MVRYFLALLLLVAAPAAGEDRIDAIVSGYQARENVRGIAVVAMRGDQILLARGWGGYSPQSVQPFYSIGKQMTAALILRLAEQNRLDVDAPVGRYLPEWFGDEPDLHVHHLLRHTSGLANFVGRPEALALEQAAPGSGSMAEMVALADRLPRRFAPGTRHAYSNSNYTALALIAERVSGQGFAELQADMFASAGVAGMNECARLPRDGLAVGHDAGGAEAGLPPNLVPTFTGNGGACGNALDLARWTRALGAGHIVPLQDMGRGAPVAAGYTPPYGFGLSTLKLAGRPAFSHGGAGDGWGAWAAYLPQDQLTLVVVGNRGWMWGTDVGVPILRVLLGLSDSSPLQRLAVSDAERAALSGDFEDGLFEMTLRADPDRLVLTNPPFGDPIELWKQADGRFVSPARPDTFVLRLIDGRPEFDWAEHRSFLVHNASFRRPTVSKP